MKIELSPGRPSNFGRNYWRKFRKAGLTSIPPLKDVPASVDALDEATYREFYLELVRTDHPEIRGIRTVSRLNAFFAVESVVDAHRYIARRNFGGRSRIYEVHSTGAALKLDMTWLNQKFPRDIRHFGYYYIAYWRGVKIQDDPALTKHEQRGTLIEVLLSSPSRSAQR